MGASLPREVVCSEGCCTAGIWCTVCGLKRGARTCTVASGTAAGGYGSTEPSGVASSSGALVSDSALGDHGGGSAPQSSNATVDEQVLSHRQQKKQILRNARQARKGQKKVQKQTGALEAALEVVDAALAELLGPSSSSRDERVKEHLCVAFRVEDGLPRYGRLPMAHGPAQSVGLAALGSVLVRPPKYTAKFLPQEYSLLHKLWTLLGGNCDAAGVVDIGAGNANCAVLAAMLLGLTVVCVERESPRVELRAEAQLPEHLRQRVIRLESDIEDFHPADLRKIANERGLNRFVLVAKHPCGIGVDRSIDCAAKLTNEDDASKLPPIPVVGAILATCCTNKISLDDAREPRSLEFCSFYVDDVLAGTDYVGNCDISSDTSFAPRVAAFGRVVDVMSRSSAWRTASGSEGNAIQSEQVQWAELFEDSVQSLRVRRLRRIFGAAGEVRFAPRECTLQDRCLLASSTSASLPQELLAHGEGYEQNAFVTRLQSAAAAFLAENGGPIDCRPRGLKSARYDFDNTRDDELPPGD